MSHVDPWSIVESDYPHAGSLPDRLRFLVRYAVLAPSSHNTQPWRFRVADDRIDLFLDDSRWLKVADADQRELHISLGCALENLLVAAEHFGLGPQTEYLPQPTHPLHAASVRFDRNGKQSPERPASLFSMIVVRHTNHGEHDNRPLQAEFAEQLGSLCFDPGIVLFWTPDEQYKRDFDDLVVHADVIQFADPAFREELGYWIGQGVFGTSWLMSKIGRMAVSYLNLGVSQAMRDSAVLMSSPVLGLICSEANDRLSQIRAGQVYQRLSLLAAAFGIWCQPLSQVVQVPAIKREVAKRQHNSSFFPQHPFRMGYAAPEKHHTPRRDLAEALL